MSEKAWGRWDCLCALEPCSEVTEPREFLLVGGQVPTSSILEGRLGVPGSWVPALWGAPGGQAQIAPSVHVMVEALRG